jgi:hypothetical protein
MIPELRDKDPKRVVVVRCKANTRWISRRVDAPGLDGTIQTGPDGGNWRNDRENNPSSAMAARYAFRLVVMCWY